jgi:hypothetical protein
VHSQIAIPWKKLLVVILPPVTSVIAAAKWSLQSPSVPVRKEVADFTRSCDILLNGIGSQLTETVLAPVRLYRADAREAHGSLYPGTSSQPSWGRALWDGTLFIPF